MSYAVDTTSEASRPREPVIACAQERRWRFLFGLVVAGLCACLIALFVSHDWWFVPPASLFEVLCAPVGYIYLSFLLDRDNTADSPLARLEE